MLLGELWLAGGWPDMCLPFSGAGLRRRVYERAGGGPARTAARLQTTGPGAPVTVLSGGGCCILGAAIFAKQLPAVRRLVRPIYVCKGIIPEVASGIQAAKSSAQR